MPSLRLLVWRRLGARSECTYQQHAMNSTRYPDSLPEGAPTDHFGRLQSQDALSHARALVDAICAALASA